MSHSDPTLSLCLIAKNESAMIRECLSSVASVVDQVIVVDTGSSDDTVAIAQSMGAEVHFFEWCDDFSAARNEALKHVRSDWVLVLDCDERLTSWAPEAIRAAIKTPKADAFVMPLRDSCDLAAHPDDVVRGGAALREAIWLLRLFRFTPDLTWEGRVHEHVNGWLERRKGRVGSLDAPIAHYGAVPTYRTERGNSDRNLSLLFEELSQDPTRWFARTYLVEELLERNDPRAFQHAEMLGQFLRLRLIPSVQQGRAQHGIVKALSAVGVALSRKARFAEVVQLMSLAQSAGIQHPNLDFLIGLARENQAHGDFDSDTQSLEQAKESYLRVLGGEEAVWLDALIGGIRSWNGLCRLSTVLMQLGHLEDALEGFELAGSQRNDAPTEIALGRCETLIRLRRFEEALSGLHPLMEADPQSADVAILVAEACEGLGDKAASDDFWRLAEQTVRLNLKGLHRLQRLNQQLASQAS